MKKILALLLALMMVMSMTTVAFADGEAGTTDPSGDADTGTTTTTDTSGANDNTGSITIDKAHVGTTYSIYQILVLTSYDTAINSYIYEPHPAWKSWIADPNGGGQWLTVNENGTVKWNGTATQASAAAFCAAAIKYAKDNNIVAGASDKMDSENDVVKFENLNLGYYLVDSTLGALCSIDTVMPNTTIEEKNTPPALDKKVKDSAGNWQESISASIGKEVEFATKLTIYPGTHNFVYHDKMESTLDYVNGSVKVYYTPMTDDNLVDVSNYTVTESGLADGCTFEVKFNDAFMSSITQTTQLTVVYKAVLNETAVISGDGNVNEAKITYGEDGESEWDPAKVYTYKFGIVKTDISNHVLQGAEFELYYTATGGDAIPLVAGTPTSFTPEDGVNYYRPATAEEQSAAGFTSEKIQAGKACVYGIRSGVALYLEETQAPQGYNPLAERYHITALTGDNVPTFTAEGLYDKGGVEVENLAGAQLPQTGGMGTTLFYVFGGLLLAVAVVLLVTKKRMSAAE